MKTKFASSISALTIFACSFSAMAADYPSKPIEVIIPYGAGGSTDTTGRVFINAIKKSLGADVVPLNVAGAGGTIGMAQMFHSEPDGYTLGFSPIAPVTVQPHLRKLPYGMDSFEPVCLVSDNPNVIAVAPDSELNSIDDLVALSKSGKVVAVGAAPGSMPHIVQAAVANAYGTKFTYLPAGNAANSAKAVLGGEATFSSNVSSMVSVNGLKGLAVLADERLVELPDIPTLKEQGEDLSLSIWFGLFAPQGTSEDKLDKLDEACSEAVQDPEFLEGMKKAQSIVRYLPRSEFKEYYQEQFTNNKELLELIGVKAK
ncbi:Bug family tripartite tricarboxylate transporter substrate binding protein [Granulosicoccus sp. 3-233]|uniref:Bug family tripartite tricarboxylate transporter substrate binding protein n=1 Tax=Granulosicoccus sp. 3-233 TaxID=3417969 RepID=UPI003D335C36